MQLGAIWGEEDYSVEEERESRFVFLLHLLRGARDFGEVSVNQLESEVRPLGDVVRVRRRDVLIDLAPSSGCRRERVADALSFDTYFMQTVDSP